MSIAFQPAAATPPAPSAPRGRWALSGNGIATVIRLELRQRVRSSRWQLMLGLFFVTIAVFCGLTMAVSGFDDSSGSFVYGAVAFIVLTMGLLVAPAMSSTSINGDRASGTLATLQMTLLSPAEIVLGKLLAGWFTALVFMATAMPFLLLAMLPGGTSPLRFVVTTVMMAVMLLTMCAIALGFSALTARTVSSVVMTYLVTAFLCLGTLLLFGLSMPFIEMKQTVPILTNPPDYNWDQSTPIPRSQCAVINDTRTIYHTELTWWLLAANPYVVVADAAPGQSDEDVFSIIKIGVRTAANGPELPVDECWAAQDTSNDVGEPMPDGVVWPFGLIINGGLAAGALALAVHRLSLPVRRLPRGTRIA